MKNWGLEVPVSAWAADVDRPRPLRRKEIEGYAILEAWKVDSAMGRVPADRVSPFAYRDLLSCRISLHGPWEFIEDAFLQGLSLTVVHDCEASAEETMNALADTGGKLYSVRVFLDGDPIGVYHSVRPSHGQEPA